MGPAGAAVCWDCPTAGRRPHPQPPGKAAVFTLRAEALERLPLDVLVDMLEGSDHPMPLSEWAELLAGANPADYDAPPAPPRRRTRSRRQRVELLRRRADLHLGLWNDADQVLGHGQRWAYREGLRWQKRGVPTR